MLRLRDEVGPSLAARHRNVDPEKRASALFFGHQTVIPQPDHQILAAHEASLCLSDDQPPFAIAEDASDDVLPEPCLGKAQPQLVKDIKDALDYIRFEEFSEDEILELGEALEHFDSLAEARDFDEICHLVGLDEDDGEDLSQDEASFDSFSAHHSKHEFSGERSQPFESAFHSDDNATSFTEATSSLSPRDPPVPAPSVPSKTTEAQPKLIDKINSYILRDPRIKKKTEEICNFKLPSGLSILEAITKNQDVFSKSISSESSSKSCETTNLHDDLLSNDVKLSEYLSKYVDSLSENLESDVNSEAQTVVKEHGSAITQEDCISENKITSTTNETEAVCISDALQDDSIQSCEMIDDFTKEPDVTGEELLNINDAILQEENEIKKDTFVSSKVSTTKSLLSSLTSKEIEDLEKYLVSGDWDGESSFNTSRYKASSSKECGDVVTSAKNSLMKIMSQFKGSEKFCKKDSRNAGSYSRSPSVESECSSDSSLKSPYPSKTDSLKTAAKPSLLLDSDSEDSDDADNAVIITQTISDEQATKDPSPTRSSFVKKEDKAHKSRPKDEDLRRKDNSKSPSSGRGISPKRTEDYYWRRRKKQSHYSKSRDSRSSSSDSSYKKQRFSKNRNARSKSKSPRPFRQFQRSFKYSSERSGYRSRSPKSHGRSPSPVRHKTPFRKKTSPPRSYQPAKRNYNSDRKSVSPTKHPRHQYQCKTAMPFTQNRPKPYSNAQPQQYYPPPPHLNQSNQPMSYVNPWANPYPEGSFGNDPPIFNPLVIPPPFLPNQLMPQWPHM